VLLEYVGDDSGAAPRLAEARLDPAALDSAWQQLVDGLQTMVDAGWVHADLSAYNLLWWESRVWLIDVPQAVELHRSALGYDLLHRDLANVCRWFSSQRVVVDADDVFGRLLR
jgi:RIO kinase 1